MLLAERECFDSTTVGLDAPLDGGESQSNTLDLMLEVMFRSAEEAAENVRQVRILDNDAIFSDTDADELIGRVTADDDIEPALRLQFDGHSWSD